jgi:hypothetical protein
MPEMRKAGGERRAVIKDKLPRPFPLRDGFFKNIVFFPEFEDFFL